MPDIHNTQVAIIGAGPTGLTMVAQLMRYGIDFILLEKKESITHLSKAVVVQARSLEIFEEMGLSDRAISNGRITTGISLYHNGKEKASIDIDGLGKGLSHYPFALSLEQSKTEKLLADHITENGKRISWSSEVVHIDQDGKGVTVTYKDGAGQEKKIKADYLAACDGASSLVRHQLGLPFEGDTVPKIFYVADMILSSPVICEDRLYMFMIPKGFVLFFPMEGKGHYRVIGILPGADDKDKSHHFSDISGGIQESINVPVTFEQELWFSSYKVHSRKVGKFYQGRCYLAGDAAHIHTPAGGQGMNTGIQDAYNLAWKMAMTLKGETDKALLETYNTEREQVARDLLATTDRMFEFMTGQNPIQNFVRLHIIPPVMGIVTQTDFFRKRMFPVLSEIGISYPDSALTIKSGIGKVNAGDRMPYFVLKDDTQIFAHLSSPVFKLVSFGSQTPQLEDSYGIKVQSLHFDEIPHVFDTKENFHILLRPDNHISYIGRDIGNCLLLLKKFAISGSKP